MTKIKSARVAVRPCPSTAVTMFSSLALAAALATTDALAAVVTQTGGDTSAATSSFVNSARWSNNALPSGLNTYVNNGSAAVSFATFTPAVAATFGGSSLTLGLAAANRFGFLVLSTPNVEITVDQLILNGGKITSVANGESILLGSIALNQTTNIGDGSITAGRTMTLRSDISGVGGMTVTTAAGGVVRLDSSSNTYAGTTAVSVNTILQQGVANAFTSGSGNTNVFGTLQLNGFDGAVKALQGNGVVENGAAANATLTLGGDGLGDKAFTGVIRDSSGVATGTLDVAKVGSNREVFTGNSTYSGGTVIRNGQLRLNGASAKAGSGPITVSGDTAGTLELNNASATNALTLSGRSTGTAHINNISGANTLSGLITLAEGTPDPDSYNIASSGGTLNLAGGIVSTLTDGNRTLNLGGAGSGIVGGGISMAEGANNVLNKSGAGKWTLQGALTGLDSANVTGGVLGLETDMALTGDLTVGNGGTVRQINGGNRFGGVAGAVQIDGGGTLDLNGFDAAIANLTGNGTVTSSADVDPTLILGSNGLDTAFGGTIQDGAEVVALAKIGSNTVTLSGASTYTGSTDISAGTLQAQNNAALGNETGGTTIGGTGQLALAGGITTAEPLTIMSRDSGTGQPQLTSSGDNTVSGAITLDETGGALDDDFGVESTAGTLTLAGPVTATGANDYANLSILGAGNTVVDRNVDLSSVSHGAALYSGANGDVTVNGSVNLSGLDFAQIGSFGTGDFALNGPVDMSGSGSGYADVFSFSSGKMTFGSTLDMSSSAGGAIIQNLGAGEIVLDGVVAMTGSPVGSSWIGNAGVGKIVVNGTLTDVPLLVSGDGQVEIGDGAQINGATTLRTGDGGTIDASAVVGSFTLGSGQTIDGSGTMIGNYVIAGGAAVTVGIDNAIEDLSFVGDLTFAANSVLNITIDLTGTPTTDFLDVDGILSISGLAEVNFDILNGPLTGQPYVFARYDGLSGLFGGLIPDGYIIDYNYNGNNEIALVMRPVPVPAPLALIGLGALALARTRRYAQR